METVTRMASAFLGVDDRPGTLEKGNWASIISWSSDPFDPASHPLAVDAEGQPEFEE